MDYGKIDFLSTSQGRTAADASLGVTNRIISGSPEDVFRGRRRDLLRMSFCLVGWLLPGNKKKALVKFSQ